jgi:hypothetical protein
MSWWCSATAALAASTPSFWRNSIAVSQKWGTKPRGSGVDPGNQGGRGEEQSVARQIVFDLKLSVAPARTLASAVGDHAGSTAVEKSDARDFSLSLNHPFRQNFFWHTICVQLFVAKKFQVQGLVPTMASVAEMNLRLATLQLASTGVAPRAKRIHQPRRRLEVAVFLEAAVLVKIRHVGQNLGSVVTGMRPAQSLPA